MITEEILSQFQSHFETIWSELSKSVSTASGKQVEFQSVQVQTLTPSEAVNAVSGQALTIQFEFTGQAPNAQAFVIQGDAIKLAGAALAEGEAPEDEESVIPEIRPSLEAIVQGLCASLGTAAGTSLIASDLAIRYQTWVIPAQWEGKPEVLEVSIEMSVEGKKIPAKWIVDLATIEFTLGISTADSPSNEIPFEQIQEGARARELEAASGLDRLMDIPLEISVELGRMKLMVREIVELGPGSIIEVNKAAGEPVDVLVNGRLVAKGEVVVIEDNFGVRITEILNRSDRLNRISEVA